LLEIYSSKLVSGFYIVKNRIKRVFRQLGICSSKNLINFAPQSQIQGFSGNREYFCRLRIDMSFDRIGYRNQRTAFEINI